MTLLAGDPAPIEGFTVIVAQPAKYELKHISGYQVSGPSEQKVLAQAADWVAAQAARKDGGNLAAPVVDAVAEPDNNPDLIEA